MTESALRPFSEVVGALVLDAWRKKIVVAIGIVVAAVSGYAWAARSAPVYELHATVAAWLDAVNGLPRTSAPIEVLSTAMRSGISVSRALDAEPGARANGLSAAYVAANMSFRAEAGTDVRVITFRVPDPVSGANFLNRLMATVVADPAAGGGAAPGPDQDRDVQRFYAQMIAAETDWVAHRPKPHVGTGSVDQVSSAVALLASVDTDLAGARASLHSLQDAQSKLTGASAEGLRVEIERARAVLAGLEAKREELEISISVLTRPRDGNAANDPVSYRARFDSARALYQEAVTNAMRTQLSPPAAARLKLTVADPASAAGAVKVAPRPMNTAALAGLAGLLVSVFLILVGNAITQMQRAWPRSA